MKQTNHKNPEDYIKKLQATNSWHELTDTMQSGPINLTDEMLDIIVYTACIELDDLEGLTADLRSIILGLLSQAIFTQKKLTRLSDVIGGMH